MLDTIPDLIDIDQVSILNNQSFKRLPDAFRTEDISIFI